MADNTKIEWTEATWNPITGCSVTSPGCTNCYAMKLAGTRLRHHESRAGLTLDTKAGPVWTGEVRFNEQWLTQPLLWRRPRMIFVCAHGDLFHESVPDEWIDRVFAVMALAPQHTFQVLTKRSARMREYVDALVDGQRGVLCAMSDLGSPSVTANADALWGAQDANKRMPLPNVWLGVSAEDQARWDERVPDLTATPASIRWVSAEPLLEPIYMRYSRIDWVVAGGESGQGARGSTPEVELAMRGLRDQCAELRIPFFAKQNYRKFALPEDLWVREWPESAHG